MTLSEDALELTERIHDYREQVADLTEERDTALSVAERALAEAREYKRLYEQTYRLYSRLLDRTIEDLNRVEERTS